MTGTYAHTIQPAFGMVPVAASALSSATASAARFDAYVNLGNPSIALWLPHALEEIPLLLERGHVHVSIDRDQVDDQGVGRLRFYHYPFTPAMRCQHGGEHALALNGGPIEPRRQVSLFS